MVRTAVYICKVSHDTPHPLSKIYPLVRHEFDCPTKFDTYVEEAVAKGNAIAIKNFERRKDKYVVDYYVIPQENWNDKNIVKYKL